MNFHLRHHHYAAAGIVPCLRRTHILLGSDTRGLYSPFAGKTEPGENALSTALREFHEETSRVFPHLDGETFRRRILHTHTSRTPSGKPFVMFVVRFDGLEESVSPFYPNHEKQSVRWFPLRPSTTVLSHMHPKFKSDFHRLCRRLQW